MTNNKFFIPIILLLFLIPGITFSQQDISNSWEGILDAGSGNPLKIIINISKIEDGKFKASLDSPDQGAFGIPAGDIILNNEKLIIAVPSIGGTYEGNVASNYSEIKGEWKQSGQSFPLTLTPVKKVNNDIEFFSIWQGKLKINEIELRVNLKFFKDEKDSVR
ncbi:MAG: hypothetical protein WAM24_14880, partial [Ignavibacteriaceae bacterium]